MRKCYERSDAYDTVKEMPETNIDESKYENYQEKYKQLILESIEKEKSSHE